MGLAPGGGDGLKVCTFAQFGVDPTTGKQLNNDPVQVPGGLAGRRHRGRDAGAARHVRSAARPSSARPASPGRPTDGNPWKLFLLLEGQGLRIKLVGDVTPVAERAGAHGLPEPTRRSPFTHFRLKMGDRDARGADEPDRLRPARRQRADLTGYSGKPRSHEPVSITPDAVQPRHAVPGQHRRGRRPTPSRPARTRSRAS